MEKKLEHHFTVDTRALALPTEGLTGFKIDKVRSNMRLEGLLLEYSLFHSGNEMPIHKNTFIFGRFPHNFIKQHVKKGNEEIEEEIEEVDLRNSKTVFHADKTVLEIKDIKEGQWIRIEGTLFGH
jgi:hypothetical protein